MDNIKKFKVKAKSAPGELNMEARRLRRDNMAKSIEGDAMSDKNTGARRTRRDNLQKVFEQSKSKNESSIIERMMKKKKPQ